MEELGPYIIGFILGAIAVFAITMILFYAGTFTAGDSTDVLVRNFCIKKGYDTGVYKQIPGGIEMTCSIERGNTRNEMKYIVRNGKIYSWIF